MDDKELHKKVRDAIFLEALGSWEESCVFDELSDEVKQIYEGYATAAMEVYRDELAKLRATVRQATAMEHAGHEAIEALRAVSGNPCLSREQQGLVSFALLEMFDAKPRWSAEIGRIPPNSEA